MSRGRILVIDDEPELVQSIRKILVRKGFSVTGATSGEEGLLALQQDLVPDLVLTDLMMPGIGGIEVLRIVKERLPDVPVLLITAHATLDSAIQAIRAGAWDYLPKPFGPDDLLLTVERAFEHHRLRAENRRLRARLGVGERDPTVAIVGTSESMTRLKEMLHRVGPTELSVLITGESGTGKEVVARVLHQLSRRSRKPFVPVDCAAIPANLMESELFGHERGAFTGANTTHRGLVEMANGGTFFLDEIGEIPQAIQVKLLRLLQEREFRRVGGTRLQAADLRVVAATNRDLDRALREGRFREDLYHRLNVVHIAIPPLRERLEDVPLLLASFLERFATEEGREPLVLGPDVADRLSGYDWPGNVRELVNCARYLSSLAPGPVVRLVDLPLRLRKSSGHASPSGQPAGFGGGPDEAGGGPRIRYDLPYKQAKRLWLEVFEYAYISHLLKESGGNVSHAARRAGIDRKSIQRLMKRNRMDNVFAKAPDPTD